MQSEVDRNKLMERRKARQEAAEKAKEKNKADVVH